MAVTVMLLAPACGDRTGDAPPRSGVTGLVHLGPECPVEQADQPCPDRPATGVTVTVSEQLAGDAYASGRPVGQAVTDDEGRFEVAVEAGDYVVTAEAGMSCELMDARVDASGFVEVDVPCDTGIR